MKLEKEKEIIPYFKVIIFSAIISFIIFMVILFVIPYTVNNWVISSVGNNESSLAGSWISFWGSFLGGIVGMFAVLLTTYLLIKSQNQHHKEQLEQQRDDVVNSINSSVRLEREKFMVQFNIEKYEKALLLLLKLDNKVDIHLDKYNEAVTFISKSIKFTFTPFKKIPEEQYKIYLDSIEEVEKQIREILQELSTLEKIVKSFGFEIIYTSSIYQYLIVVNSYANLLNSTDREKIIFDFERINVLLGNTKSAIKSCEEKVHTCIEQELLIYRPKE